MTILQRLPFWAALVILAGGLVAGIYVATRTHELLWFVGSLVVVVVAAVVYLYEYSRLPEPAPHPSPPAKAGAPPEATTAPGTPVDRNVPAAPSSDPPAPIDPVDLEPEYDPVEEADEIESAPNPSGSAERP